MRHVKRAAVKHDIALNLLNAHALQAAQDQPYLLDTYFRVALSTDINIALQHTLAHHAIHGQRCAPGVSRPQ